MHVAAEVGFWRNPKTILFSRLVRNPLGGAYILQWREFVLLNGDVDGNVRGYNADEIAAAVGWNGKAAKLIEAFKAAGVIGVKRRVFFHPAWKETPTGRYAELREWDRQRKRKKRMEAADNEGGDEESDDSASVDVQRTSGGRPGNSSGRSGVSKLGTSADADEGPPGAPPEGGGEGVASLWEWLKETHPRPLNPSKCKRLLARLTPDDIEHLRYALPIQARSSRWKNTPRFVPALPKYLEQHGWLEVPRKRAVEAAPKPKPEPTPAELAKRAEEEAQRERMRRTFELRAEVKERLKAEGLRGEDLEIRVDQEVDQLLRSEAAA